MSRKLNVLLDLLGKLSFLEGEVTRLKDENLLYRQRIEYALKEHLEVQERVGQARDEEHYPCVFCYSLRHRTFGKER